MLMFNVLCVTELQKVDNRVKQKSCDTRPNRVSWHLCRKSYLGMVPPEIPA